MVELFVADETLPFAISIGLMVAIAILEGVGMLLGLGFSQILDALFAPGVHVGADIGLDHSLLSGLWGWLHIGRVPFLVLLIVFLTSFGLIGLTLQGVVHGIAGTYLPGSVASVPAFLLALPVVRVMGQGVARLIPQDESTAVSQETFIGRVADITQGTARKGMAAEARLKDEHGHVHYVMVEPDLEGSQFSSGSKVLLVRQEGVVFKVIEPPPSIMGDG